MRQFEQTLGVVENIDTTSRQLKEALEAGKTIIVTTLQKFPVIAKEIGELPGKRFAVIVDEAHSSQSGESTKSLKAVLAAGSLEEAEARGGRGRDARRGAGKHDPRGDGEAGAASPTFRLSPSPPRRSRRRWSSSARPRADGKFEPFHLYSMRQAIEEGFILDVLATTRRTQPTGGC